MDLSGKVAVVTGGTRGIGFEIVKKYLQNGAAVVLFGSRQETVEKALAKLQEENAEWKADGLWPNLSKPAEVEEAIQKVK
ncbi:MAG: SDR family NAD(P)-dependent oxidoreductase, partial [Peptococcaceae bacterium]|nr:SDR family NAD(P)-dependent oxidoreductase [Peptococcaceae bacterium]